MWFFPIELLELAAWIRLSLQFQNSNWICSFSSAAIWMHFSQILDIMRFLRVTRTMSEKQEKLEKALELSRILTEETLSKFLKLLTFKT